MLTLVPCSHFWCEMKTQNQVVTAICNKRGCKARGAFSMSEWEVLALNNQAINKPVRV